MKIIGIITARGGSKGIPAKNIKILNGKPLIGYTIEAALNSNLDRVVVTTESEKIARIAREYGVEVMSRPYELALDSTPTLPVLLDVVNRVKEKFDAVMTLQPTSPLRTAEHINQALELFKKSPTVDSLISVVKVPHNFAPEKLMTYDGQFLKGDSRVRRRQDLKTFYARNGAAIYITRTNNLNKYVFGGKIVPFFMDKLHSFDIDDSEDWLIVENLMRSLKL